MKIGLVIAPLAPALQVEDLELSVVEGDLYARNDEEIRTLAEF